MVSRLFDKALELLALIEERGRLKVTQGKNMVFAAFVVLQAIFYGADNVVMKVAYGEVSPLWCQTLRFGLAFALFMALFGKQIVKGLRGSRVSAWLPVGVVYAVAFVASSLAVDMTEGMNVVLRAVCMLLILLVGHAINIGLCTISSLVHPLRLIFVEYYKNAEFEGGGKEYKPFKKA